MGPYDLETSIQEMSTPHLKDHLDHMGSELDQMVDADPPEGLEKPFDTAFTDGMQAFGAVLDEVTVREQEGRT